MSCRTDTFDNSLESSGNGLKKKKLVILNLRGVKYEILLDILDKIPDTRLAKLKKLIQDPMATDSNELLSICDDFDLNQNEFYFNRNSIIFESILDYYSTNRLHVDSNLCTRLIMDELKYWNIEEHAIDKCCEWKFLNDQEATSNEINKREELIDRMFQKESFDNFYFANLREKINYLVEKPSSSIFARIFFTFSVFMILLYTTATVISTMPQFKIKEDIDSSFNKTTPSCLNSTLKCSKIDTVKVIIDKLLNYIQMSCVVWFIFETFLRFISSSNFLRFIKNPSNLIDIFSNIIGIFNFSISNDGNIFDVFAIIRVFLLIRLVRHFKSLQILIYVFKSSLKEIFALFVYILFAVLIFSSMLFLVEKFDSSDTDKFDSIPSAFWLTAITITTVGFGDIVPVTPFGKLIVSICAVSGILLVPLPMAILAKKFTDFHHNEKRQKEIIAKYSKDGNKILKSINSIETVNNKDLI